MAQMSPERVGWAELRRAADDPRPPGALVVGLTVVAGLVWSAMSQAMGLSDTAGAVGVVVIAVVASWWATVPGSTLVAVVSFLVADGFVQDQFGQLHWNGSADAALLLALLVGCVVSADVRSELIEDSRLPHPAEAAQDPDEEDSHLRRTVDATQVPDEDSLQRRTAQTAQDPDER